MVHHRTTHIGHRRDGGQFHQPFQLERALDPFRHVFAEPQGVDQLLIGNTLARVACTPLVELVEERDTLLLPLVEWHHRGLLGSGEGLCREVSQAPFASGMGIVFPVVNIPTPLVSLLPKLPPHLLRREVEIHLGGGDPVRTDRPLEGRGKLNRVPAHGQQLGVLDWRRFGPVRAGIVASPRDMVVEPRPMPSQEKLPGPIA
jgi:hypothetical protein